MEVAALAGLGRGWPQTLAVPVPLGAGRGIFAVGLPGTGALQL